MLGREYKIAPPEEPEFRRKKSVVDFEELKEGVSSGSVCTLERPIRQDCAESFFAGSSDDGERPARQAGTQAGS